MQHIRDILRPALNSIAYRFAQWKLKRDGRLQNQHVQYWQAGALGGGTVELGNMTRYAAIQMVREIKDGPIIFIDDKRGFIAFGKAPQSDV